MGKIPKRLTKRRALTLVVVLVIVGLAFIGGAAILVASIMSTQDSMGAVHPSYVWIFPFALYAIGFALGVSAGMIAGYAWLYNLRSRKTPTRRGWYRDAASNSEWRYWDGAEWATEPESLASTTAPETVVDVQAQAAAVAPANSTQPS